MTGLGASRTASSTSDSCSWPCCCSGRPSWCSGRSARDRKSTRLNSSHEWISYAVFSLKKKPAIEACGTSTLSQSPMLGFHKQMDNRIKFLEEILSFRMQGVEFDNGDMYVDGHKAASDVRDEFVSVTEKLMDELAHFYYLRPHLDLHSFPTRRSSD